MKIQKNKIKLSSWKFNFPQGIKHAGSIENKQKKKIIWKGIYLNETLASWIKLSDFSIESSLSGIVNNLGLINANAYFLGRYFLWKSNVIILVFIQEALDILKKLLFWCVD